MRRRSTEPHGTTSDRPTAPRSRRVAGRRSSIAPRRGSSAGPRLARAAAAHRGGRQPARAAAGHLRALLVVPLIGIALFLVGCGRSSRRGSQTSLGALPGPGAGLGAGGRACAPTHVAERAKEAAFYAAAGRRATPRWSPTGKADEVKCARLYRQADLLSTRSSPRLKTVFARLPDRHADRGAAGHRLRPVADGERARSTR